MTDPEATEIKLNVMVADMFLGALQKRNARIPSDRTRNLYVLLGLARDWAELENPEIAIDIDEVLKTIERVVPKIAACKTTE